MYFSCSKQFQFYLHLHLIHNPLSVCKDVTVKTQYDGQSVNWKLGNCHNARQYDDYREYIQRCCLTPAKHTLTCINNGKPEGWKNSRLSVQGVEFCYDFMSFKVFRQITVKGKSTFRNTHILCTNIIDCQKKTPNLILIFIYSPLQ